MKSGLVDLKGGGGVVEVNGGNGIVEVKGGFVVPCIDSYCSCAHGARGVEAPIVNCLIHLPRDPWQAMLHCMLLYICPHRS